MKIVATRKVQQNGAAVDPWTAIHLAAGLAVGLMDVSLRRSLAASAAYELVEQYVERTERGRDFFNTPRPESLPNALVDVAAFAVGHRLGAAWNRTGG